MIEVHSENNLKEVPAFLTELGYDCHYRQSHVPSLNLKSDDLWCVPR